MTSFISGRPFYTGRLAYKNSSDPKVANMPVKRYEAAISHPYNPLAPNSKFEQPKFKSFKKGGMVHKTGVYRLHKGEMVVPKNVVDSKHKQWMMSDTGSMKTND